MLQEVLTLITARSPTEDLSEYRANAEGFRYPGHFNDRALVGDVFILWC